MSDVTSWPAYRARERVLADLEAAIAARPEALDTRFYYASFLRDHGRFDEALATLEGVLAAAPGHRETMLALGVLLARRGRRLEARAIFEEAVELHPGDPAALVNLAHALALDQPERAAGLYHAALALDAAYAPAHRGLCGLAAVTGDREAAGRHRAAGYAAGPFGRRPYLGATMPVSVLALVATGGGNVPLDALLDERVFLVHELFVDAYRGEPLPPHDLVVNAIADADRAPEALHRATEIAGRLRRPVINVPAAVARTGRVANAVRLGALPGVTMPAARTLRRDAPGNPRFPLIVRAPGLHMGRGMVRVNDPAELAPALAALRGRGEAIAIDYVDTRSLDGAWRKYRVMAVGGVLYPLHLAIAHRWDVHYFSAAMGERAEYRAEEARFLASAPAVLGAEAWAALGRVRDALGLDYAGIDFALDGESGIVIFEANAGMTVLHPGDDPRFSYRAAASDAIAAALEHLFRERAKER